MLLLRKYAVDRSGLDWTYPITAMLSSAMQKEHTKIYRSGQCRGYSWIYDRFGNVQHAMAEASSWPDADF